MIDKEYAAFKTELEVVTGLVQRHISANAHTVLDQAEYQRQYDEYAARFEATRHQINEVSGQREVLIAKRGCVQSYLDTLKQQELISELTRCYGMARWIRYR